MLPENTGTIIVLISAALIIAVLSFVHTIIDKIRDKVLDKELFNGNTDPISVRKIEESREKVYVRAFYITARDLSRRFTGFLIFWIGYICVFAILFVFEERIVALNVSYMKEVVVAFLALPVPIAGLVIREYARARREFERF